MKKVYRKDVHSCNNPIYFMYQKQEKLDLIGRKSQMSDFFFYSNALLGKPAFQHSHQWYFYTCQLPKHFLQDIHMYSSLWQQCYRTGALHLFKATARTILSWELLLCPLALRRDWKSRAKRKRCLFSTDSQNINFSWRDDIFAKQTKSTDIRPTVQMYWDQTVMQREDFCCVL